MKRGRPGRPRSQAAHQAILEAAIQLVREVGYEAVTMDAVAARAKAGKATLYRRWKTKEALICESLEGIMRSLPSPDTGTLRGDLAMLMRAQRGLYADPASAGVLVGLLSAMHRSERIAHLVRSGFHSARENVMRQVLVRAVRRGELRTGFPVQLGLDLLNGPLFYRYLYTGRVINARLTAALVTTVMAL